MLVKDVVPQVNLVETVGAGRAALLEAVAAGNDSGVENEVFADLVEAKHSQWGAAESASELLESVGALWE